MLRTLGRILFTFGYNSSGSKAEVGNFLSDGSSNVLVTGANKNEIFKGVTVKNSVVGSKIAMNVGDTYGGLGDFSETGIGNIFRVLGAIFFIGAGKLYYQGAYTSASASVTLSIKKVTSGVLGTTYQAGLAQPSAPVIFVVTPPAGFSGKNGGNVTVKIARVRAATGARSIASLTSNIAFASSQSVAVTFPSADTNGQDYWEVDVTRNGFGGLGNHYFLAETAESVIAATVTANVTTSTATTIDMPNDTLTSANIGWVYTSAQAETNTVVVTTVTAGNAKSVVTAAGMSGGSATVTVPLAGGESASAVATLFRTYLSANVAVSDFFTVGGTGVDIILTARTQAANDGTMNFTIEDVTSTGITDDTTSTNSAVGGEVTTYVTAVGADDSGGAGEQRITLNTASLLATTQPALFTRGVKGVARTYVYEWQDADLAGADLAPYLDYPPPAGIFGGVINDVVFVDGCLGDTVDIVNIQANTTTTTVGNVIAVSEPAKPESFPPDNYLFTSEPPTAVMEGGEGLYWRFGANSLGIIRYVGGSPALSYERIWTGIGVQNQNQVTLGAGGRLYAFTGKRGLVRLGTAGEPDTSFAAPVMDDLAALTVANTVLGYDSNHGYVLIGHGATIWAFYEAGNAWCAPMTVTGLGSKVIKSIVTISGSAYLSFGDGAEILLYDFNVGSGSTAKAVTCWIPSGDEFDIVSRIRAVVRTDNTNSVTVKTFTDGNYTTAKATQTASIAAAGYQQLTTLRPNVRQSRMHRVELSYTSSGGNAGFESVETLGSSSGVTR